MEDPFISFMIWKGAILIGIAGAIAFWEGYTGKKLFRRGGDANGPPGSPRDRPSAVDQQRLPNHID